ncbi:MAG: peptide deformylase [Verrucomicrobia bacterium]|jgi:peptide deformylase|nr:peptide deformylase [Verrucomicrobiota bacterium]
MQLRVTYYGEPILEQPTVTVESFGPELERLSKDMIETMYTEEGVGLAAPQVDSDLRLCVVDVGHLPPEELSYEIDGRRPPVDLLMPMTLVNPRLRTVPGEVETGEEGCLSFPGIRGPVPRASAIDVDYQDLSGQAHLLRCSGWFARVVQHEVDHLDGVLFIDRMAKTAYKQIEGRVRRLRRQTQRTLPKTKSSL